jgi:hypothetical protein
MNMSSENILIGAQGVLHEDDDHEEEFEIDINEAEPEFLKGQSSRSGVEVLIKADTNPEHTPAGSDLQTDILILRARVKTLTQILLRGPDLRPCVQDRSTP